MARGLVRSLLISWAMSLAFTSFIPFRVPRLLTAFIFGLAFGIGFFSMGTFILPRLRRKSFAQTILLQAVAFYATIALCFFVCLWPLTALNEGLGLFDAQTWTILGYIFTSPGLIIPSFGAFLLAVLITMVFQVSRKMGPGVLWNWMTGKYHEPREEERIFMFLDLKDSTTLAEQMGNLIYSSLVRDFFADLSGPLLSTHGEVSHYIGDEAVIGWRPDRGIKDDACVRCFFLMEEAIQARASFYLNRFGLVPEFKAGMHVGPVVATEVGEVKSEIVYHGDVLNTAARIQGLCNELGEKFLVSGELAARLTWTSQESYGQRELKGKDKPVEIVALRSLAKQPSTENGKLN